MDAASLLSENEVTVLLVPGVYSRVACSSSVMEHLCMKQESIILILSASHCKRMHLMRQNFIHLIIFITSVLIY